MAKKKVTSEKTIKGLYQIVKGFDIPDGEDGKEKRFNPGNKFVEATDFAPDVWKALVQMEAVAKVEEEVPEEEIAAEIIK